MKSLLLLAALATVTLGISGLLWFNASQGDMTASRAVPSVALQPTPTAIAVVVRPTPTPSDATVTLALVGDILPLWVNDPLRDAGVRAQLQGADIAFANLEAPLSTRGQPAPLKFRGGRLIRREFIFGATPADAQMLDNAGIDVVSLANNHMMDYGATALADTLQTLDGHGIATAGGGADSRAAARPAIVERRGVKVAFLSYVSDETLPGTTGFEALPQAAGVTFVSGDGQGTPDAATRNRLRAAIEDARRRADMVGISFHWGNEFHTRPNPFQRRLARFAVDVGADFVVGHHPHCLQGVEVYRGKLIFYSLGNFVFHSKLQKSASSGIAHLEVGARGVKSAAFSPVWVWDARPQTDHPRSALAATVLRDLSSELGTSSQLATQNGSQMLRFDLSQRPTLPTKIAANAAANSKAKRAQSSTRDWVEVKRAVSGLVVERPYASTRNVFKMRFYFEETALLRRGTAAKLRAAQTTLAKSGARLKLWDGYRPPAIQQKMWDKVRDSRYVADPKKGGSRHNRGCAVDVTLVGKDGRELEMPTAYDDFSARAHADAKTASPAARRHRALLRAAMTGAGFKPLATEWWHFDDAQCAIYPIAQAPRTTAISPKTKAKSADAKSKIGFAKSDFVKAEIEVANAKAGSAQIPQQRANSANGKATDARVSVWRAANFTPVQATRPLAVNLKLKRKFGVATGPKSLRTSPSGNLIVVNNLYAHCITLIEPATGRIRRRIEVPGEAVECVFTEGGRKVWVSLYDKNRVVVVNLIKNRVVAQIPTGKIPKVVEVSRDGKWVYAANWSSQSITVMDAVKLRRVKDVKVGNVPRGIAFTRDGRFAYVANMGADTLSKIDVKNGHRVVKTIRVGGNPRHLVLSRDGRRLYISHNAEGVIRKLDTATDKVMSVARVGRQPRTIALSRDDRLLFVCNYADNNVGVVDVTTMRQISTTPTSVHPVGATVARDGTLWISNYRTNIIMQFEVQRKAVRSVVVGARRS